MSETHMDRDRARQRMDDRAEYERKLEDARRTAQETGDLRAYAARVRECIEEGPVG
jgi:hypothetical protein